MLPWDVAKRAKHLLATGEFATTTHQRKEMVLLGKYLLDHGMSETYVIKQWWRLWKPKEKYLNCLIENELEAYLARVHKVRIFPTYKIKIYESEINAINQYLLPMWVKQYLLLLLGYFKMNDFKRVTNLQEGNLVRLTEIGEYTVERRCVEYIRIVARDAGLLTEDYQEWFTKRTGEPKQAWYYSIPFIANEGIIAFEVSEIEEMIPYFSLLKNQSQCPICHRVFDRNYKSSIDTCPECAAKEEQKRLLKRYTKKPEVEITCPCCGTKWMRSGNGKRELCEECWKEKEKGRKRNIVDKRQRHDLKDIRISHHFTKKGGGGEFPDQIGSFQ